MNRKEMKELLIPVLGAAVDSPENAAEELINRYGSLTRLAMADEFELSSIESVGKDGAYLLRLVFALSVRARTDGFKLCRKHTEEEIVDYFRALFLDLSNETVDCMLLDRDDKVVAVEYIGEGTVNSTDVIPRKMLEAAIKKNARKIIIAHNHPAGNPSPSVADIDSTSKIASLLSAAGREVLCHYIVSGDVVEKIEI